MKDYRVDDLLKGNKHNMGGLGLVYLYKQKGDSPPITIPDINRPGLALTGYYEQFGENRIQIFGRGETAYLHQLTDERKMHVLDKFFHHNIPCVVFTHALHPPFYFEHAARAYNCPILQTNLKTFDFIMRLIHVLSNVFAARTTVHGVFLEVFGIGVLLLGESGIGKSETALELLERGHRMIADDVVLVRRVGGHILVGCHPDTTLQHFIELRGLGIVNVAHLFGVGAVRSEKRIQLIAELTTWNKEGTYDRTGLNAEYKSLLDVSLPYLSIPIRPGRNVPILIETAAMNARLKDLGYFAAQELNTLSKNRTKRIQEIKKRKQ